MVDPPDPSTSYPPLLKKRPRSEEGQQTDGEKQQGQHQQLGDGQQEKQEQFQNVSGMIYNRQGFEMYYVMLI